MRKAIQNRRVQILCSYWVTEFLELRQELLKAGQSQLASFEIRQIYYRFTGNNYLLKSEQRPPLLKAGQDLPRRFSKAFRQLKSFLCLRQRIYKFNVKLKGQLKFFRYLPDSTNQDPSYHTTFSQL